MKKLRLLLFKEWLKDCEGCCNKNWDLDSLPIAGSFKGYDEIMLTGGEPMLKPTLVFETIRRIRDENQHAKIYLYTSYLTSQLILFCARNYIQGVVITLHDQSEVEDFMFFDIGLSQITYHSHQSLRLNIFDNVSVPNVKLKCNWKIKKNIRWIKNCPLPENEEFKRL